MKAKVDNISKTTLQKEDLMKQFGEINKLVETHYYNHKERPNVIIISKTFQYGLSYIMADRTFMGDCFGNKIETLFGIPCIVSPRLKDLEFEVY